MLSCTAILHGYPARLSCTPDEAYLNLNLTSVVVSLDDGSVRRFRALLAGCCLLLSAAPVSHATDNPWFAGSVGDATQVVSVVGAGGSSAKMDIWQRSSAGWQPIGVGIPTHIGSAGMTPQAKDDDPATPMGIFTLPYVFGTAPSPGGGLQYVQVGPDDWWDGDQSSPTYNTHQRCRKEECRFDTSASENLDIPAYVHSVVIGVNEARVPGNGSAFFMHAADGGPTAGCVAIDDGTLVQIIRWMRPGALIAIAK
jgi:L,D-peptidoglycan transpeptidase YkuD (ErfK/YbiS/YcfS/YnhG family)